MNKGDGNATPKMKNDLLANPSNPNSNRKNAWILSCQLKAVNEKELINHVEHEADTFGKVVLLLRLRVVEDHYR